MENEKIVIITRYRIDGQYNDDDWSNFVNGKFDSLDGVVALLKNSDFYQEALLSIYKFDNFAKLYFTYVDDKTLIGHWHKNKPALKVLVADLINEEYLECHK